MGTLHITGEKKKKKKIYIYISSPAKTYKSVSFYQIDLKYLNK